MSGPEIHADRRVYKLTEITAIYGMSRSSIYRAMKRDGFPVPFQMSERSVRWWREDVEQWFANRPQAMTPCADNAQYQGEGYLTSRPGKRGDA